MLLRFTAASFFLRLSGRIIRPQHTAQQEHHPRSSPLICLDKVVSSTGITERLPGTMKSDEDLYRAAVGVWSGRVKVVQVVTEMSRDGTVEGLETGEQVEVVEKKKEKKKKSSCVVQ
ncbi:hypothetical protein NFI96_025120 [Prochilodus magdalenae]|nr:hypothetical protein NFI96_025120 [Prochilodus magdalenae]